MTKNIIKIVGLEDVTKRLDAIENWQSVSGKLGVVFSTGAIQFNRRYDHYVMHPDYQAAIHRGRWKTDKQIAAEEAGKVAEMFRRYNDKLVKGDPANIRKVTNDALKHIVKVAKTYPPELTNQRYIRTFTLQDSWTYELLI